MTDGQTLFAVFALLYLIECLRLAPSAAWMAAGAEKSRWSVIRPWSRLQIASGSPLLLSVLPPHQAHTSALPWLFVPEQDSLRVRLTDSLRISIAWDRLSPQAEESTLHLDAVTRLRLNSPALAQLWAQRLTDWREWTPEQRHSAFLKHARASLDPKAAAQTATSVAKRTQSLRLLASILFVWCFGIISVIYHRFGDGFIVLAAAGVLLLLQFTQSWLFLRVTRGMQPGIPHRRWRALGIAFLPQLAMRAADAVSLAGDEEPPHPLAWRGLIKDDTWLESARRCWREARYIPGWSQNEAIPVEAEALQAFFRRENIAETDYDPPAASKLPVCPRCGAEFQTHITACTSCGGVELRHPPA
ncbi:MAG TPA: hypothetical protein DDZ88_15305 [Verrucomicrobiales bacterium]|nr:hypothetical protein [Verrucomicrobiales bacterium]